MTSIELQQKIDTTTAEITNKQERLNALPEEKRRVITSDEKKLLLLEKEESELPGHIDRLRERTRLLSLELETALKTEAGERLAALAKEWAGVSERVSEQTGEVRKALEHVAGLLAGGHAAWEGYAKLAEENRWLSLRYRLPRLIAPPVDRLAVKEVEHFAYTLSQQLQQPTDTNPWLFMTQDLEDTRRRESAQTARDHPPTNPIQTSHDRTALNEALRKQDQLQRAVLTLPSQSPIVHHESAVQTIQK